MVKDLAGESAMLTEYLRYLLELRTHHAILASHRKEAQTHEILHKDDDPSPLTRLCEWSVPAVWQQPQPGICFFQYSPWGQVLCNLLLRWMQLVRWNASSDILGSDFGVSWIEMMLSFTIWSGILPPIRREHADGGGYLQGFTLWTDLELHHVTLGEMSGNFSNWVQQVRKLMTIDI